MTFIPLLGYYILRPRHEPGIEERRGRGFAARYYHAGQWAIRHRWLVLTASFGILVAGGLIGTNLKKQFFPKDLSYLAFMDIFLPEDAPFNLANRTAQQVESIVQRVSAEEKRPLESLSTFVGGGGPRFWYSLSPEPHHPNYAQIVLLFKDKHDTGHLLPRLQERLSREVAGARIDVRQLETGDAVGLPVAAFYVIRVAQNVDTYEAVGRLLKDTDQVEAGPGEPAADANGGAQTTEAAS